MKEIKDLQEREIKEIIAQATYDVISSQTNPVERILKIEWISEYYQLSIVSCVELSFLQDTIQHIIESVGRDKLILSFHH